MNRSVPPEGPRFTVDALTPASSGSVPPVGPRFTVDALTPASSGSVPPVGPRFTVDALTPASSGSVPPVGIPACRKAAAGASLGFSGQWSLGHHRRVGRNVAGSAHAPLRTTGLDGEGEGGGTNRLWVSLHCGRTRAFVVCAWLSHPLQGSPSRLPRHQPSARAPAPSRTQPRAALEWRLVCSGRRSMVI
jgi:hypothetical protein